MKDEEHLGQALGGDLLFLAPAPLLLLDCHELTSLTPPQASYHDVLLHNGLSSLKVIFSGILLQQRKSKERSREGLGRERGQNEEQDFSTR